MGDPRYFGGPIPFVKISDVTASDGRTLRTTIASVTEAGAKRSRLIQKGSLILSNSGTICVPIFLGVAACIHDGFVTFEGLRNDVFQNYLFHFFHYVRPYLRDKHKQGVTQVNLNTTIVGEITIPLPPLAEQKRIVAKIEELFSELDAGEARLRRARQQLQTYRQSLLKQAFEGKLTAEWRGQDRSDSSLPKSWRRLALGEVGRWQGGGTPNKANKKFWENGTVPWVSPKDMKLPLITSAQDYITEEAVAASATSLVEPHSVLLVTRSGILSHSLPCAVNLVLVTINQDIKALTPHPFVEAPYLRLAFSNYAQEILSSCRKAGTTVSSIEFPALRGFAIPLCPLPEQQEIVRILDEQMETITHTEREIDSALKKSTALRQSILRKAFTGRLVPQENDLPDHQQRSDRSA
jgi:type I restriction enzyme, S subunit